ncbi:MAG: S8 family peptidase [Bryobacterales bacterium]|nr:S8 family peptidase [Bryobacterales bacterium]
MTFDASRLRFTLLDLALQQLLETLPDDAPASVLLELHHAGAAAELLALVPSALPVGATSSGLLQARLTKTEIHRLETAARQGLLYKIWLNHRVRALTARSTSTIKADAALTAFRASGKGIVWAVADSGIAPHSHFDTHHNLELPPGLVHRDFTGAGSPLTDEFGHGTHVAGILAGQSLRDEGQRGIAPQAKLISLKVLGPDGEGEVSDILAALDHIQQVNDFGRRLFIHGVNLSLGYEFDPEWFACGASPLCVQVDRLVHSGVCVVVAAGNSGYGPASTCLALTINDPANAELAITVGSTHRDRPHSYGVSYFSSKGPTGDGRRKPDLVAPGERIISCASPVKAPPGEDWRTAYVEDSGTSMAAPHVSGAIAALLSVRCEFIGKSQAVKEILLASATDLRRDPHFQGRGLLNLFAALQER